MNKIMLLLERHFALKDAGTSFKTEMSAGVTTFLTMAYIIFVQPAVLSGAMFGMDTGMDFQAIAAATCISAAFATLLMAFMARYPIALAPGMGQNFFFVFSTIPAAAAAGFEHPWQVALGVIFYSGVLFLLLTILGVRETLIDAISPGLKNGIAVGIGIFIAFIGMQNAGLIVQNSGTLVALNPHFAAPDLTVFFVGLLLTAVLMARRIRGAILLGILGAAAYALLLRAAFSLMPASITAPPAIAESRLVTQFAPTHRIYAAPASIAPVFWKMDLRGALSPAMWHFILIFLFMDVFDTMGTVIGVAEQAGLVKDNRLPRSRRVFLADSIGTLFGATAGTSTVTSFIESAAGVAQGGRTGLTGICVAVCFLVSLFFGPLIAMIGGYAPITAPALVIVGFMMFRNITKLDWDDPSELLPALLIVTGIPLTYSISDGLTLGFISYPLIKLFSGKARVVHPAIYVTAVLLFIYAVFLR